MLFSHFITYIPNNCFFFASEEVIDKIYSYIHQFCFNIEDIDIDDMLRYKDHFEVNEVLCEMYDFKGAYYKIETEGEVNPYDGGEDILDIKVYLDNNKILSGEINLYYGHVEFNDDGNVGDASEESIEANIDDVIQEIRDFKSVVLNEINNNTRVLDRIIENLGL